MELARMDNKGASPLRIVLVVAAILVAIVFVFAGQLYLAGGIIVAALILAVAMGFSRAKTPTD
jgi:hypothetical protein